MTEEKIEVGLPLLGGKAPDFEAQTTQGTLRLSDYEGSWLVLFSHPADFTPVCTTEFIAFSEIYGELQKRNTELLGLSVDSVSSHIAWIRNVEEKMGVKIPFPIIADLNKEVSLKFGMIHPAQSKTEKDINPFEYNMGKIMWDPDSVMIPTNAPKTIRAKTGIPDVNEAKS